MFDKRNKRKDFDFMNIIIALNPGVKHPEYINDTNELDEQINLLQKAVKATFYKMLIIVGAAFIAFFITKYKVNKNINNDTATENKNYIESSNNEEGEIKETSFQELDKSIFENYSWDSEVITSVNDLGLEVDSSFPAFSIVEDKMILIDHKDNFDIVSAHTIGKDSKKPLIRADKVRYLYADNDFIVFVNQSNKQNYGDEFVFIDHEGNLMENIKPSDNPITISSYAIKNRDIYFTINNSSKLFKINIDSKKIDSFHTNHSQEVVLSYISNNKVLLQERKPFEAAEILGLNSASYIHLDLDDPNNISLSNKNIGEYTIIDNDKKYVLNLNQNNNDYSLYLDDQLILNHFQYAKIKNNKVFFIRDGLFQSFNINDADNIKTYDVDTNSIIDYYVYDKYIILITKSGDAMYNNYIDLIQI